MTDKDAYVQKAKARLDQWNADIDKLKAQAAEASADARIEYEKQIAELRAQRDTFEEKLKEIRNANEDAWRDMSAGFEQAWKNMSAAFEQAMTRYK